MKWSNQALSALVNPITAEQLADFMALDYDASLDGLLNGFISTACEIAVNYTNHELLARDNLLTIVYNDRYKAELINDYRINSEIKLPRYPVSAVADVVSKSEQVGFSERLSMRPAYITVSEIRTEYEITYMAGYPTVNDIPATYLNAIKTLAAFIYNNRGDCNLDDVIKQSGAKLGLDMMRVQYGAVI